jgi:hypothetical protein
LREANSVVIKTPKFMAVQTAPAGLRAALMTPSNFYLHRPALAGEPSHRQAIKKPDQHRAIIRNIKTMSQGALNSERREYTTE